MFTQKARNIYNKWKIIMKKKKRNGEKRMKEIRENEDEKHNSILD